MQQRTTQVSQTSLPAIMQDAGSGCFVIPCEWLILGKLFCHCKKRKNFRHKITLFIARRHFHHETLSSFLNPQHLLGRIPFVRYSLCRRRTTDLIAIRHLQHSLANRLSTVQQGTQAHSHFHPSLSVCRGTNKCCRCLRDDNVECRLYWPHEVLPDLRFSQR